MDYLAETVGLEGIVRITNVIWAKSFLDGSLRPAQIMKVGASAGSESTVVGAIRATSIGTTVTVFVVLYEIIIANL